MEMKERIGDSDLDRFLEANPNLAKRMVDREPLVELAVTLLQLRASLGLTQEELAHKAGLTPSQLSEYENAANAGVTLRTLSRLAKAVGASVRICYDVRDPKLAGKVVCHILRSEADYVNGAFVAKRAQPPVAGLAA